MTSHDHNAIYVYIFTNNLEKMKRLAAQTLMH